MKNYYTPTEYKELVKHMTIICDTRENTNQHILDYFEKHDIPYEKRALKTGDYSFKISPCPDLGFSRDAYFTDVLAIERKNSVNEIAGNLVEKDGRFMREIGRMTYIQNVFILIENDSLNNIIEGNYRTKIDSKGFLRTLLTTERRAGFHLYFVDSQHTGYLIHELCKNVLDSYIMRGK